MSLLTVLTLIFLVLKLTNYIDWSWWFVFAPSFVYSILWFCVNLWWESKTPIEKVKHKYGLK